MGTDRINIEDLVQACLESIESGQETIESILARYPDQADELRSALDAAAWLSSRADLLNPRPGFVMASRARLVEQIQREAAAQQTVLVERTNIWQALRNLVFQSQMTYRLVLMLFLVLAIFTLTGGAVLAASDTLPGDPLYPVKLAYEKVQLSVSLSTVANANLHIEFAQRRLVEIQKSVEAGRYEPVKVAVDDMQWQVGQTIQLLDNAAIRDTGKAREVALDLQTALDKEKAALSDLAGKTPAETSSSLENAAQISEQSLLAVQGILEASPNPVHETNTPTASATATRTPRFTFTPRPSATPVPSATPTPTATVTATPSPTTTEEGSPLDHKPTRRPTHTPKPTKTEKPPPTRSQRTPKP